MKMGQGTDGPQYNSPVLYLIGLAQTVTLALSLAFAREADRAMSKGGIGDYERFARCSGWAGIAFWALCGLWMAGVVCAILDRSKRFPLVAMVYAFAPPLAFLGAFIASLSVH